MRVINICTNGIRSFSVYVGASSSLLSDSMCVLACDVCVWAFCMSSGSFCSSVPLFSKLLIYFYPSMSIVQHRIVRYNLKMGNSLKSHSIRHANVLKCIPDTNHIDKKKPPWLCERFKADIILSGDIYRVQRYFPSIPAKQCVNQCPMWPLTSSSAYAPLIHTKVQPISNN